MKPFEQMDLLANIEPHIEQNTVSQENLNAQLEAELGTWLLAKTNHPKLCKVCLQLLAASFEGKSCLPLQDFSDLLIESDDDTGYLAQAFEQCFHDYMPNLLVLQEGYVYLQKYHQYESDIIRVLGEYIFSAKDQDGDKSLHAQIDVLFADNNEQKNAAKRSLTKKFSIISGGPGTGKTTTIAKIIALLYQHDPNIQFALAAPTGKAAQRLGESLRAALTKLQNLKDHAGQVLLENIQFAPKTLHKLLHYRERNHLGLQNVLPFDVIVVDESSMLDLDLMRRLFTQLKPKARLILLGDEHQLNAVDIGGGFAALCKVSKVLSAKQAEYGFVSELLKSHRFDDHSTLGKLAKAVLQGDAHTAQQILQRSKTFSAPVNEAILQRMEQGYAHFFKKIAELEAALQNKDWQDGFSLIEALRDLEPFLSDLFVAFNRYRLLAATRKGKLGLVSLNAQFVQKRVKALGLLSSDKIFTGMMLMITQNDYELNLFNGDIGLVIKEQGQSIVVFENFDQASDVKTRFFSLDRLQAYEVAFAMTIHKSQGSEFEMIDIVLGDQYHPIMDRSLVYTALTRSKADFYIHADMELIQKAIQYVSQLGKGFECHILSKLAFKFQ